MRLSISSPRLRFVSAHDEGPAEHQYGQRSEGQQHTDDGYQLLLQYHIDAEHRGENELPQRTVCRYDVGDFEDIVVRAGK